MLMTHLTSCRATPSTTSRIIPLLILSVLLNSAAACSNGNCQLLESCSAATDCASGLYCGNCAAESRNQPFCIRGQALIPTTIVPGKPFNKYSWLVTHNAFSNVNAPPLPGVQRLTFYNQEDTVANQLRNGVRGLMLDMYDFENSIWLCHSFRGQCYNITAFNPAIDTLKDVEAFLTENPSEIVTIIIEDYVHTPNGLTKLFADAGLAKYWFPVSKMPKKGEDWPTVSQMVQDNHRLLVFTSDSSKEQSEGVAYQWRYMLENERNSAIWVVQEHYQPCKSRYCDSNHASNCHGNLFRNCAGNFWVSSGIPLLQTHCINPGSVVTHSVCVDLH